MPEKSRIVIVDDHPVMRMGLSAMLNATHDLQVVAEAGSSNQAIEVIESLNGAFDLVILDLSLPDRNGLELLKDLRAMEANVRCLVISSHDESLYAERVLRAGGRGYVTKDQAPDCLLEAARTVLKGGVFLSPEMTSKIMQTLASGKGSGVSALTDRELEVYRYLGEGKSSREIAGIMSISVRTVDAHRTHIKDKLGLRDAADLTYQAIRWVESQS